MQFVWEVYETMLLNKEPYRHVAACSRGAGKTMVAATLEFLALIHFRRNIVHMSAIRQQSKAGLSYLKQFCRIDLIRPYFSKDKEEEVELNELPVNEFTKKTDAKLLTVSATLEGTNSSRPSLTIYDEVDLTKQNILSEAALMATPTLCGNFHEAVSVYLSSRKTNDGPLQALIEESEIKDNGIRLHKYSMADWMKKCPEKVHGEHGVKSWINKDNLRVIWDNFPLLTSELNFEYRIVYEGCRKCPAFIICQGRSPKQTSTSRFLKSIASVKETIKATKDPGKLIAQGLNWRPESSGTVFSSFSRYSHCKTPREALEWIIEKKWNTPEEMIPTKQDIYEAAMQMKYDCTWGIDWGYRDPAVVVVILHNRKSQKTLLLHVRSAKEYANHQWAESCLQNEGKIFKPNLVCPDMADAASGTYFRGLPTKNKKPHLISTGVSHLRGLLFDPLSQQSRFAIAMFDNDDDAEVACVCCC